MATATYSGEEKDNSLLTHIRNSFSDEWELLSDRDISKLHVVIERQFDLKGVEEFVEKDVDRSQKERVERREYHWTNLGKLSAMYADFLFVTSFEGTRVTPIAIKKAKSLLGKTRATKTYPC